MPVTKVIAPKGNTTTLKVVPPPAVENITVAEIRVDGPGSEDTSSAEIPEKQPQKDSKAAAAVSLESDSEENDNNDAEEDENFHEDGETPGEKDRSGPPHYAAIKLGRGNQLPETVKETIRKVLRETGWDGKSHNMPAAHYMKPFHTICKRSGVNVSHIDENLKSAHKGTQTWLSAVKKYAYSAARTGSRVVKRSLDLDDDLLFTAASPASDGPNLRKRKRPVPYSRQAGNTHDSESDDDDEDSIPEHEISPGTLARMQHRAYTAQRLVERSPSADDAESDVAPAGIVHKRVMMEAPKSKDVLKHDYINTFTDRLAEMAEQSHTLGIKICNEWLELLKNGGQQVAPPPPFDFMRMIYTPEMLQGHAEKNLNSF